MANRNQKRGDVFEFSRKQHHHHLQSPVQRSVETGSAVRPVMRAPAWQSTALFSLCLLLVLALGLAFHAFKRVIALEQRVNEVTSRVQGSMEELRASVNFDSLRRRLLVGMRDEILRVNSSVSLTEAYRYAELLLDATDKYPSVDPLLLLSIGIVESGFDTEARSAADARGLYQIWPSTGRMLAGMLGWEYTDDMLYDSKRNTEMAALYMDILMTTYNDLGMALAEYNGGPINAGYYRAKSRRASPETLGYVPKVLRHYERLAKKLPMAPGRSYDVFYREPSRLGKRLGETTQPQQVGQGE